MDIREVNKSWIHYSDGSRENATEETLQAIMNQAAADKIFYSRMHRELSAMFDKRNQELRQTECPTEEEVKHCGIVRGYDAYFKREEYKKKANENSGILSVANAAFEKKLRAQKIESQAKFALGIQGR